MAGNFFIFQHPILDNQRHDHLVTVGIRKAAGVLEVLGVMYVRSFVVCVLSFVQMLAHCFCVCILEVAS